MGQSQLLVIAVTILVIGLAIIGAVYLFHSDDVTANKNAMINDMNQLAHVAVRYYVRPAGLDGGGHSFAGFTVPEKFSSNINGTYSAEVVSPTELHIFGVSARDSNNTITAEVATDGKASNWTFGGDFR